MRVFVTGGSGFIGGAVVRQLVRRGHRVTSLARTEAGAEVVRRNGAEVVPGDMNDREALERGMAGAQAVVHAASPASAERPPRGKGWQAVIAEKVQATELLAEAALRNRVEVFVMSGGARVARPAEPGGWVNEAIPPAIHSPVSRLLLDPENVVRLARLERKLPAVCMRPSFAYGSGGTFGGFMVPAMQSGNFLLYGSGEYWWSVAHVDDVAEAYALAVEQMPVGETFIVADDHPVKFKDFVTYTAELLKVRGPRSIPVWLARMVAGADRLEYLMVDARYSNAHIKQVLGWQARYPSYREGVPVALAEIANA